MAVEHPLTPDARTLVRHLLAALAYRTQKALRDAPEGFADFSPGAGARTPRELVRHMTGVLGYARTFLIGGVFRAEPLPGFVEEIRRFHGTLTDLAQLIAAGTPLRDISAQQLLQGPLSDAMTHAGQLALLRRLSGSPVPSENFVFADISPERLDAAQPLPAAPTPAWMGRAVALAWRMARFATKLRPHR